MRKDRLVGEVLGEEVNLSPSDLYNTDFKTSVMGGYDKKEVDAFLERVGDVFEALLKQLREHKDVIEDLNERVSSSREMESTLRNALASAQKYHQDTLDAARREAAAIHEQAKLTLGRARMRARELPDLLRGEIAQLRNERNQLRNDLDVILDTHAALTKKIPRAEDIDDDLFPPEAEEEDAADWSATEVEPESEAGD